VDRQCWVGLGVRMRGYVRVEVRLGEVRLGTAEAEARNEENEGALRD
jgi:hypothetical protein